MTANLTEFQQSESLYFIAPDGEEFHLSEDYEVIDLAGLGISPVSIEEDQSYRQEGSTRISSFHSTREFQVLVSLPVPVTRAEWWTSRQRLLAFFRTNRSLTVEPFQFVLALPHKSYALDCYPNPGPEFVDSGYANQQLVEPIVFTAHDPFFYEYPVLSNVVAVGSADELTFPITFDSDNIYFESAGTIFDTGDLGYEGTAPSYPKITIDGPYNTATLQVNPQGTEIQLLTSISAGEQRILDTDPVNLSLVDGNGVSKFEELSIGSDLVNFKILPEPPGDGQSIRVTLEAGSEGTSSATLEYRERFLGI
jgi:hypothetical protein